MSIIESYDEDALAGQFGPVTLARGREYAGSGHVESLHTSTPDAGMVLITGRVRGSYDELYTATVTAVGPSPQGWLDARCTCPVVRMCKHAAATMLVALEQAAPQGREWERRLTLLLDELDEDAVAVHGGTRPLALQLDLPPGRRRRSGLRIRPLQRGARDNWVKSQVGWTEVPYLDRRADVDPAQAAVLGELLSGYRAANRSLYYGGESHLTLSSFGAGLWPLLARAEEVRLALVPAGDLRDLRVQHEALALSVDVVGAGFGEPRVEAGVRCGDDWFAGDRLEVIGASGHGVALWTPTRRDHPRTSWDVVLAPLTKPVGPQTRRLLASHSTLPVPQEDLDDLVHDFLPRLRRHVTVESSDRSVRVPEAPMPRLGLTVTWKAVDEVHVAWSFRYRVGEDDRSYALDESRGLRGIRRPDAEAALVEGLDLDDEQRHRLCPPAWPAATSRLIPEQSFTGPVVVAFTEDTLVPLEASGQVEIEEIGARPDFRELTDAPVITFQPRGQSEAGAGPVDGPTDWLDLEVLIRIGDRYVGLAQLLEAMTLGAERIVLRDGAHLRIDRPEFAQLTELVRAARELEEQPSEGVRMSRHDLGLWAELAEIGLVDAQASQWVQAARALRDIEGLPHVEPVGIEAELRSYQADGFRWLAFLWQSRLGGILADDMGLGKTLQTLALIAHARANGGAPFLVVAPTSVVATWAAEAATFTPGLTVRTVTESRSRRGRPLTEIHEGVDVVVTSYTLYRLEADDYVALDWGGLVLDEAQTVKNHQSKTYQCVRRLDVPFRLALTGTPMENRLIELWSLLSIVAPGLYPHPARFVENVANPVEKEGDADVLDRFRRRIRPFLLRRTKERVADDLPPKQEQVLEVQLTPRHRRVYETHLQRERQNVLGLLGEFDRQRVAIFRSLTRLRQLALDAALLDEEYDAIASAKTDVLVDHLLEVVSEGHRALVFSQFTSYLTRVRRRLEDEGIACAYLDGRTRKRAEVVGGFKSGDAPVFLISLKAGGTGLTLTEADYVFVLDPWWNPAVEAQAVDRAHRIGQRRPVIVYRLVATGTIEEKVMALKERKAALFADVLDGDGAMSTPIDADDVRALFEG